MKISRLVVGVVAVPITVVVGLLLALLESAALGVIHPLVIIAAALSAGGALFSLADKRGWLSEGPKPLSLFDSSPQSEPVAENARPIEPK